MKIEVILKNCATSAGRATVTSRSAIFPALQRPVRHLRKAEPLADARNYGEIQPTGKSNTNTTCEKESSRGRATQRPRKIIGLAVAAATAIAIPAEGLRQYAYRDPVGILTTCYGSTMDDADRQAVQHRGVQSTT